MSKPKKGIFSYLIRIAAILALPLFISSLILFLQNRSLEGSISWAEIQAPFGTRTDFYLPDGSTGHLNGGSSLKFPVEFTGEAREVMLIGEAYFDVVSNKQKPFIVSTNNIDIKATGTSFNVMAYADEPITEVTLKNGQVEIFKKRENKKESMGSLKLNEAFIYNFHIDSGKIRSVNTADRLSWIEGKLTFKYDPFESVIQKLNRWYNVNIVIKDKPLKTYIYYGTFQNETLDEVLRLLQFTAPIKYKNFARERKMDGSFGKRKIEIYSKNKQPLN